MRALLLIALSACSASVAKAPKASAKDFYPLEPGTIWTYKAVYLGQEQTRTVVMGPVQDGFSVDDAGAKLAYDGEGLRDEHRYLLREPMKAGQSWNSVAAIGASETYTILKAHTPCATKQLKFEDCVEVKSTMSVSDKNGGTLENTMVFARHTGLVRLTTVLVRDESRTTQVDMELVSFKAAGGQK